MNKIKRYKISLSPISFGCISCTFFSVSFYNSSASSILRNMKIPNFYASIYKHGNNRVINIPIMFNQ